MLKVTSVLVPTNFSAGSRKAVEMAAEIAESNGARLTIMHVGSVATLSASRRLSSLRDVYHRMRVSEHNSGNKQLLSDKAAAEALCPSCEVSTLTVGGPAHNAICEQADQLGCDLIVMATSGITGLSHLMIGSTAARVIRMADVPVLTVKTS